MFISSFPPSSIDYTSFKGNVEHEMRQNRIQTTPLRTIYFERKSCCLLTWQKILCEQLVCFNTSVEMLLYLYVQIKLMVFPKLFSFLSNDDCYNTPQAVSLLLLCVVDITKIFSFDSFCPFSKLYILIIFIKEY